MKSVMTPEVFEREHLARLNPEQREAVMHREGPMLVLAGAGSGKTRVLTVRIANLVVNCGYYPHQILALTFTNKAAREMRARVETMLGDDPRGMFVGTFHSFGARLLRQHAEAAGWSRNFTILDSDETLRVVKRIMKEQFIDQEVYDPRAIRNIISAAKNAFKRAREMEDRANADGDQLGRVAAAVYRAYEIDLADQNALDFDDLLVKPVELFQSCPEILDQYRKRFRQIMVDEYQDTNAVQFLLLSLLAQTHRNITVVGDDDQSIYAFRGADIRNILNFEAEFGGAKVVRLERNYRSTETILSAANAVISNNLKRKGKNLRAMGQQGEKIILREAESDIGEARWVADEVANLVRSSGRPYRDFAVLYRTNAQSRILEEMFRRRNVPHIILGGLRFFERREIMDTMAYLRLVSNPDERAAFERVVNWPRRGVGKTSVERLLTFAHDERLTLLQAAERADEVKGIPACARKGLKAFAQLIRDHADMADRETVGAVLRSLVNELEIVETLRGEKEGGEDRAENVQELLSAAYDFDPAELGDQMVEGMNETDLFVQHISLLSDVDQDDPEADAVVMMTLHSAKGLEFPVVFIVGMEDGLFPHSRSKWSPDDLEEERRLFYVGITRAKEKLHLAYSVARRRGAEMIYPEPSMFLREIPEDLIEQDRSFHF